MPLLGFFAYGENIEFCDENFRVKNLNGRIAPPHLSPASQAWAMLGSAMALLMPC